MRDQLDMFAPARPPAVVRTAELLFVEGLLGEWFKTRVGRPPRKKEKAVLSAHARRALEGFGDLIAAAAAEEETMDDGHDLTEAVEGDEAPDEIREDVTLPGADVEVPDEIEERLRDRPETPEEQELD